MSIANALNNALTGLSAASRGTEIVASNLANALTPGYARRELQLSPRILAGGGGGVAVSGVSRIMSEAVLSEFRLASAQLGGAQVTHEFRLRVEAAIGLPGDGKSLAALIADTEAALISAASRPDSEFRLGNVVDALGRLLQKTAAISQAIQQGRTDADRRIAADVDLLNASLGEVSRLNRQIIVARANGGDAASLVDARQAVIDRIATIVPVRELPRDGGRVALFTAGGAVLIDGKDPVRFGFQATGQMTPRIDGNSTHLGRLTIDGEAASDLEMSLYSGGSLSARFAIRDEAGIAAQAAVDGFARDLYARLSGPGIEPGRPPGTTGLITDGGSAFDPSAETGLAQRLRLAATVDPDQGGALWRLRDGVHATAPGEAGDAGILNALSDAMSQIAPFASPGAPARSGNLSMLAAEMLSSAASARLAAETRLQHDRSVSETLEASLLQDGVDSDREMELLLQLERAYAANAKVVQAIDDMIGNLLRI
ncbi:flagellar hook-associated protein 1 FlgK [Paracoccus isoporae]|uniref:Flagellar hook-associated protein 1 n=1 Tax=Paracoccus isoporae TaxID=591205 RepID=A0A1G6V4R8_9RHOB|nr:flagellar basal body rod C-terminal domain-containing protein [Paracoccus isoporae]SDD47896.1 flagellar hook-associated protein 1 FlgK [Paracoccus isoporae]